MHIYTAHVSPDVVRTGPAQIPSLTAQSRGRGCWDCVRQMQMYRRRPDVLAAALRDMGFSDTGDDIPDVDPNEADESPNQRDVSLN
jgi:hypothetical protein